MNAVTKDFYNKLATLGEEYRFLSPVHLSPWRENILAWLYSSRRIGEFGVGKGELANFFFTNRIDVEAVSYSLVDVSSELLHISEAKLSKVLGSNVELNYIVGDLQTLDAPVLAGFAFDHVLAINIMQDVDATIALRNLRKALIPGGKLRVTFLAKETADEFLIADQTYDGDTGHLYTTSSFHDERKSLPLGFIKLGTAERPFYRIQRFYSQLEIRRIMKNANLAIEDLQPITYPKEFVLNRWRSQYHRMEITPEQLALVDKWDGYPDGWDASTVAI